MALLRDSHPRYGTTLSLAGWRTLSSARRALVLRHWLAEAGAPMPSEARLDQICHQLDTAAVDRQVLLQHGEHRLRVYRGRILLEASPAARGARGADPVSAAAASGLPTVSVATGLVPDIELSWGGERRLPVPGLGGVLCFESAPVGVDPAWLAGAPLRIGLRRGRERLRQGGDRPSRSLKNLYQEAGSRLGAPAPAARLAGGDAGVCRRVGAGCAHPPGAGRAAAALAAGCAGRDRRAPT
nr:TilS substrate-binding domain-containing protein [Verticiella sp. GG226]